MIMSVHSNPGRTNEFLQGAAELLFMSNKLVYSVCLGHHQVGSVTLGNVFAWLSGWSMGTEVAFPDVLR